MLIKLRKKLINWLRESDNYDYDGSPYNITEADEGYEPKKSRWNTTSNKVSNYHVKVKQPKGLSKPVKDDIVSLNARGISFTVYPGAGGVAIEARSYDQHQEDYTTTLHVVPESDELSEALAHIITLQALRQ